jgi:arsenate reductase (thioredoxin)
MAEGWLRQLAGERFEALSAGIEAHGLNPGAVRTMGEVGVDITAQRSETVDGFLEDPPDLVVTVCEHAAELCPEFPETTEVLHWPFPDPAGAEGSPAQVRQEFRRVRDAIRGCLESWLGAGSEG